MARFARYIKHFVLPDPVAAHAIIRLNFARWLIMVSQNFCWYVRNVNDIKYKSRQCSEFTSGL